MKSKILDIRNCHALLPKISGMQNMQRLEECLQKINEKRSKYSGLIDALIKHNIKTNNKPCSLRYCDSILEVGQGLNVATKTINTRVIEVPKYRPLRLHINIDLEDGTVWKVLIPLQLLLKGWGDANEGYQGYAHTISRNFQRVVRLEQVQAPSERDKNDYYYVGITGRNWLRRLNEHFGEIRRGSRKNFHRAWRESLGIENVLFTSTLLAVNMTKDDAMNWEEVNVDQIAYGPNGLNMIPGGYKGLRFLHEHRITNRLDISLEERDKAIAEYVRRNPRKGIPNPLIAELWEDDDYYQRINEAHPKRLSKEQVKQIRALAKSGWSVESITREVDALDQRQVIDVVKGKTYKRIR